MVCLLKSFKYKQKEKKYLVEYFFRVKNTKNKSYALFTKLN